MKKIRKKTFYTCGIYQQVITGSEYRTAKEMLANLCQRTVEGRSNDARPRQSLVPLKFTVVSINTVTLQPNCRLSQTKHYDSYCTKLRTKQKCMYVLLLQNVQCICLLICQRCHTQSLSAIFFRCCVLVIYFYTLLT